ncbi:hypothetical protein [Variovorax sp.]|uniref:hypothetical protein n=1 Tax=Variovorax sp. TaxID=1871043 RepID=UPI003BAD8059
MAALSRADAPPPTARPVITLFRACELCAHSTTQGGRLMCNSPAVCLSGRPEVLDAARAPCGGCGPNARHLDMPGWR